MSEPYVAQIIIFGGNFAPEGWALCDGQTLAISQNTALFSLLGTNFGGNGTSNFQLPNLQGAVPIHWGTSTTGTAYSLGEASGSSTVILDTAELPAHTHALQATSEAAAIKDPTNAMFAVGHQAIYSDQTDRSATLNGGTAEAVGGNAAHDNMMPYLALTFVIALSGVFPPRS